MAATDSQKQLLTLIRDFAAEKSQGERRVLNLKKRIDELRSELEAANSDLENSKCMKETAEQELKGYEVQLSITEASIQTLEARIASIQDEISKVGSDVDALKDEEAALRDGFICQMLELKTKIRKFQEFAFLNLQQRICLRTSSAKHIHPRGEDAEFVDLEKKFSAIVTRTAAEERECETEQNLQNQVYILRGAVVLSIIRSKIEHSLIMSQPRPGLLVTFYLISSEIDGVLPQIGSYVKSLMIPKGERN